jgi:tetratricopeptide (TPR) repeat protein
MQSRIGSTFSGVFDFRQALPHIQSAMDTLKAKKDEQELTGVYVQMARTQSYLGNFTQAEEYARAGVELAERHDMLPQAAEAQGFLAWIDVMLGRPGATAALAQSIEALESLKDLGRAMPMYHGKAFTHRLRGEHAQAVRDTERALLLAREVGNRVRIAGSHWGLGWGYFLTGDWSAAGVSLQQYLGMSEAVRSWVEHAKSLLALMEGDLQEASTWARKATMSGEQRLDIGTGGLAIDFEAFLHLRMHRFQEAWGLLAETLTRLTPTGVFWPAYLHPLAAEAALALGDPSAAEEHCRQAETYRPMELKPAEARLFKARGLLEASRGAWSEAVSLMDQAIDLYETIGQPYDRAICLESLADIYLRLGGEGDEARALEAQQQAAGIYQRLGADFEVRRIEQASGGGQGPGTSRVSS